MRFTIKRILYRSRLLLITQLSQFVEYACLELAQGSIVEEYSIALHKISDSLEHIEATEYLIVYFLLGKLLIYCKLHCLYLFLALFVLAVLEQFVDQGFLYDFLIKRKHLLPFLSLMIVIYGGQGVIVGAGKLLLVDGHPRETKVIVFLRQNQRNYDVFPESTKDAKGLAIQEHRVVDLILGYKPLISLIIFVDVVYLVIVEDSVYSKYYGWTIGLVLLGVIQVPKVGLGHIQGEFALLFDLGIAEFLHPFGWVVHQGYFYWQTHTQPLFFLLHQILFPFAYVEQGQVLLQLIA